MGTLRFRQQAPPLVVTNGLVDVEEYRPGPSVLRRAQVRSVSCVFVTGLKLGPSPSRGPGCANCPDKRCVGRLQ